MTVSELLGWLEQQAPRSLMLDWDNGGLLCGSTDTEVTSVLISLDPFEAACREAAVMGAQVLLTHHPLIFRPVKSVTDRDPVGQCLMLLIQNGICAVNAHTNLDRADGGVNDVLAEALGLAGVEVLDPAGMRLLRAGQVPEMPLKAFLSQVKEALSCDGLRYVDAGRPVRRVAVGGGACADMIEDAIAAGCDTMVTADVKYNGFWDARDLGLNLIDAGHFQTENPVCAALARRLREAFPDLTVNVSKNHADCIKFF